MTRSAASDRAKRLLSASLWRLIGRRNMARLGRFISNQARLDVPNDMHSNGEVDVQRGVLKASPPNEPLLVFDVGANIGDWSDALIREALAAGRSDVRVFAFEPCSGTMRMLTERLGVISSIELIPVALGDREGVATMSVVGEGAGTNSLIPNPGNRTEEVQLTTIDAFCEQRGFRSVGFIKIDAEGYDLTVIRGAKKMLGSQAIGVLQFEYNHRWIGGRSFLRDAFELLLPLGYALGKITPLGIEFYDRWDYELETFREANYLACTPLRRQSFPAIPWWNT